MVNFGLDLCDGGNHFTHGKGDFGGRKEATQRTTTTGERFAGDGRKKEREREEREEREEEGGGIRDADGGIQTNKKEIKEMRKRREFGERR